MGLKPSLPQTAELFRPRLDEQINMKHPLVRLAALIDWGEIERTFSVSFVSGRGRPVLPARLVAELLYLQHTFDASDEAVVNIWVENPYWHFFRGETYLQTELPIDPSSLARWWKRIGEEGVETLLAAQIRRYAHAPEEGLVVGMRSMPGNSYDGHTLAETLEQVGILTGTDRRPATAIVDKGTGAWRSKACASCAQGNGAASPGR